MGDDDLRVRDTKDARDLSDDLTPFITRTTTDPIGGGGFCDVWKCNYDADGILTFVVVKAFRFPEDYDLQRMKRNIRREIGILKKLCHDNIVPLLGRAKGFGRQPEMDCLVSPWMPNGTLRAYLKSRQGNLTVIKRSRLLEDVSVGLRYCSAVEVSLKADECFQANILIDERGNAKLIDFGLSSFIRPLLGQSYLAITSIRPGAIRYTAPELVTSNDFRDLPSEKVDIYSFGCVMLQILSGLPPWFEIQSEYHIIVSISRGRGPQRPNGDPSIIDSDWDFIQKCLGHKPELRPSADEVCDFVMHRSDFSGSSRPSEQAVETRELHPTTDKIFEICPRFRILGIGKTGVGKSSLINHAFGVQKALASNEQPGQANIENEHISEQNDKFVLHDSNGFEPGEGGNVQIVQEFIQRRRHMKAMGDRLHAVWLCFEVPRAGGRILETGTEDFLQLKRDRKLGNIPVVAVLTKYDKFMDRVERTLDDKYLDGLSDDAVKDVVKERADAELHDVCAQSLNKLAGSDIPYAREYWKMLASTAEFRGRTAQAYVDVLHTDIVRVWNFLDPHRYLDSEEFKTLMMNVVDMIDVGSVAKRDRTMAFGVLGESVYDMQQIRWVVLQHFIAYIADLTLILQTLHLVSDSQELSRRAIKLAVASYLDSDMSAGVHGHIQKYNTDLPLSESADQGALNEVVKLTESFSMEAEDILKLRAQIRASGSGEDEQW
ncbi:kinase-like protein [Rhizopogon vinicolor AM-OR11-026]|uniref:Kinase-like protein n=1 Tax=Rhizopogon vinicolor AM-OR11-026 TaxID=1314800 RepID=A0A1B7MNH5_9AGAM|nr:kinase-like protein [Rhizopogon vinicolor AM-OR11-026]